MTAAELMAALEHHGIRLYVGVPAPYGGEEVSIPPGELLTFLADPRCFIAAHYGMTVAEYIDWSGFYFSVRCAARTRAGRRCRNIVTGGHQCAAADFLRLRGSYCIVHGG